MLDCKQCKSPFEITENDRRFYSKINVPEPTLCHDCRQQRRLAFRNEDKLYKRKCDYCKKPMISVYSQDKPYAVYCQECWWGDKWNPLDYGLDFDFTRPFFEQYKELITKVPLLGNMVFNSVNSEYNSFCVDSKDCYRNSRIGDSEGIFYSYLALHSERCMDCYNVGHCQDCYECIDCLNCYHCFFNQLCRTSNDCYFCYDCIGCENCFGCANLRNQKYHFFNNKCSREQYKKYLGDFLSDKLGDPRKIREKFYAEELQKHPMRANVIINSQNAVGNYIVDSKDIYQCFDIEKTDTARYSWGAEFSKDVYDTSFMYYGENCYEQISNSKSQNITFSFVAIGGCSDISYSMLCFNNSQNSFGCVSLRHQKYCILNKQYPKEEYEKTVQKIIQHMKMTGEYGEFFPISLSHFAYNESVANDFFPLKKEDVIAKGWKWKDKEKKEFLKQDYLIPKSINDVSDDVLEAVLTCVDCGLNYKIIKRELDFYRNNKINIPPYCPGCRHLKRLKMRNPRKLWNRKCGKCGAEIQTTYSPDRPERVYCEACYLKEAYL